MRAKLMLRVFACSCWPFIAWVIGKGRQRQQKQQQQPAVSENLFSIENK